MRVIMGVSLVGAVSRGARSVPWRNTDAEHNSRLARLFRAGNFSHRCGTFPVEAPSILPALWWAFVEQCADNSFVRGQVRPPASPLCTRRSSALCGHPACTQAPGLHAPASGIQRTVMFANRRKAGRRWSSVSVVRKPGIPRVGQSEPITRRRRESSQPRRVGDREPRVTRCESRWSFCTAPCVAP